MRSLPINFNDSKLITTGQKPPSFRIYVGFEGVQKVANLPRQSFKIDCFFALTSYTPNRSIERLSFGCPTEVHSQCLRSALSLSVRSIFQKPRDCRSECAISPSLWHSFIHFSINLCSYLDRQLIDWSKSHVAKQLFFHAILSMALYNNNLSAFTAICISKHSHAVCIDGEKQIILPLLV